MYVVITWVTTPIHYPIFLVSAGAAGHEDSERRVCAGWLPIERDSKPWSMEWWIAVTKGSALYSEIRSAKTLQFETDPGSGLSDVCIAGELDLQKAPDIMDAVLNGCRPKVALFARVEPERQVILHVENLSLSSGTCEMPDGFPQLRRTPPNHALQADDRLPRFARAAARR
jgi:hypothetical protein